MDDELKSVSRRRTFVSRLLTPWSVRNTKAKLNGYGILIFKYLFLSFFCSLNCQQTSLWSLIFHLFLLRNEGRDGRSKISSVTGLWRNLRIYYYFSNLLKFEVGVCDTYKTKEWFLCGHISWYLQKNTNLH